MTADIRHQITHEPVRTYDHRASARYYVRCRLGLVHRLQMAAALGRRLDTYEQVQHIDGNTADNRLDNLVLGSARSNSLDKIRHNTNGHKLRNNDIRDIRRLSGKFSRKELARQFGVTTGHIGSIIARRSWYNLP